MNFLVATTQASALLRRRPNHAIVAAARAPRAQVEGSGTTAGELSDKASETLEPFWLMLMRRLVSVGEKLARLPDGVNNPRR